jgi:hypothetical protein
MKVQLNMVQVLRIQIALKSTLILLVQSMKMQSTTLQRHTNLVL